MKPTLFLLAAGMGSRYGGLKQLDGLGPNGETIMDYSIYDAINAGFGKLVFVIRKDFEKDFVIKLFPNTKVISRANWCSSLSTICVRRLHLPLKVVRSPGEPTTPMRVLM